MDMLFRFYVILSQSEKNTGVCRFELTDACVLIKVCLICSYYNIFPKYTLK